MKRCDFKQMSVATVLALTAVACSNSPILVETEIEDIELKAPEKGSLIEFSTFANRSTRAVATASDLEFYHQTFKVYGTKTSNEGTKVQPVFEGVTVTAEMAGSEDEPNAWTYEIDRYWDKQADNYQFVAFAPAHAPLAYDHNFVEVNHETAKFFSSMDYTLVGQNLHEGVPARAEKNTGFTGETDEYGAPVTDCDIMRSEPFTVTDPATTPEVTLNFGHTLAKLIVTAKANADKPYVITIENVTVASLLSTGTYEHANGWVAKGSNTVDYLYTTPSASLSAVEKTYFIESLVMPQAVTETQLLTLNYTITSGTYSEQFTYSTNLADLFKGKTVDFKAANSYVVNFNIAPEKNIITFDTGVVEWVDNNSDNEID